MASRSDAGSSQPNLRVTIIAADGLYKRDVFRFPDPFAVITVNGDQTKTTTAQKRTLNPYWNESFDLCVQMRPRSQPICVTSRLDTNL